MRQAIRALGWATNVFWIILLFLTVTAVYSAFQISPEFGPYAMTAYNGTVTASLPFYIDNGGFYDISNLNLTTRIKDNRGTPISDSSTFVQLIPRGSNASVTHNMSMSISQMTTENLSYLLFNDSTFYVDIALKLNYANAVPFKISTNSTMPWGAPLSNLTLDRPNPTPMGAIVPLSFENHSFFELNGTMRLEIVDNTDHVVGQTVAVLNVQPQSSYGPGVYVSISGDPRNIRKARLTFQTTVFSYGPMVIPLV